MDSVCLWLKRTWRHGRGSGAATTPFNENLARKEFACVLRVSGVCRVLKTMAETVSRGGGGCILDLTRSSPKRS